MCPVSIDDGFLKYVSHLPLLTMRMYTIHSSYIVEYYSIYNSAIKSDGFTDKKYKNGAPSSTANLKPSLFLLQQITMMMDGVLYIKATISFIIVTSNQRPIKWFHHTEIETRPIKSRANSWRFFFNAAAQVTKDDDIKTRKNYTHSFLYTRQS